MLFCDDVNKRMLPSQSSINEASGRQQYDKSILLSRTHFEFEIRNAVFWVKQIILRLEMVGDSSKSDQSLHKARSYIHI